MGFTQQRTNASKMATGSYQPVAEGGLFHGSRVNFSQQTQSLLKTMMQESKLTNFQQRQLDKALKDGQALPTKCPPTSSVKPRKPVQKNVVGKVLNPRNYSSRMKTKEQIEASGAYEREHYHPAPLTKFGGYYEKDKERLTNIMTYGEDISPETRQKKKVVRRVEPPEETKTDRFTELQNEIEDRRQFLEEMEKLGKGAAYRGIIETEVSQLLREMEIIDRKRNAELEDLIASEERKKSSNGQR